VRAFDEVVPIVNTAGFRTIVPYLRGYGVTRFLSPDTPRSGEQAALGQDLLELLDGLQIPQAVLAGFDWGGRAACVVSALWPERVRGLVTCTGYQIQDIANSDKPTDPEQERRLRTGPRLETGGGSSLHRAELPVSQFPRGAYLPSKYPRINSRLRSLEAHTQTITAPPPRHYR
jgi:pimeloyl-ACP methyl ester carboxylesterase